MSKRSFENHLKTHEKPKKKVEFKCDFCDTTYSSKFSLDRHKTKVCLNHQKADFVPVVPTKIQIL